MLERQGSRALDGGRLGAVEIGYDGAPRDGRVDVLVTLLWIRLLLADGAGK